MPLNIGFMIGRFLSVSEAILAGEWRNAMCATARDAYLLLHSWRNVHTPLRMKNAGSADVLSVIAHDS